MNNYVKGNILIFIQVRSARSDLTFVKFNSSDCEQDTLLHWAKVL